ncbi:hypothetical protein Tco_0844562 [Tanacetum coccineum]
MLLGLLKTSLDVLDQTLDSIDESLGDDVERSMQDVNKLGKTAWRCWKVFKGCLGVRLEMEQQGGDVAPW